MLSDDNPRRCDEHDWEGLVSYCPKCTLETPTDWVATIAGLIIVGCVLIALVATVVAFVH